MEISFNYKPHEFQKKLHLDPTRYKVVVAGRRFGKSVFARNHCVLNAIYNPGLYWIINPTYRQGKAIHWIDLKKEVPEELVEYKNEQELSIHLINGSRIEIKGADNEDALRGVGLKGVVMDETADQKAHIWEEIIRPTLVDSEGWAVFIGTPKGFNWFYDLWLRGRKSSKTYDPEWKSWQFTSYENPHLKKREIDKAAKEAKLAKKDDVFAQEYLAQFKKYSGLIYRNFDRDVHIVDPFVIPFHEGWELYRGIDFGYGANPTVCLFIAVAPDGKWYVIDEYVETKDSSDYHCGVILSKTGEYINPTASYCDPSNSLLIENWGKMGVYMTKAYRPGGENLGNWVGMGIDIINEKMKVSPVDKSTGFYIFKTCEDTIREFELYRWKEERDPELNNPGRPEKANDHCMDALRYFAVSYSAITERNKDYAIYGKDYHRVNERLEDKWTWKQ